MCMCAYVCVCVSGLFAVLLHVIELNISTLPPPPHCLCPGAPEGLIAAAKSYLDVFDGLKKEYEVMCVWCVCVCVCVCGMCVCVWVRYDSDVCIECHFTADMLL